MKSFLASFYKLPVFRYLVAGGAAFMSEYSSFLALYYLVHIGPIVSNTASFLLGLSVSFTLNRFWVFSSNRYQRSGREQFIAYSIIAAINIAITGVVMKCMILFGIPGYAAKIILVTLVASWNYAIFKTVIFKKSQ